MNIMLYPAMLNLAGKKAVVIGGGPVAARKTASLIEASAVVEVVSPDISKPMNELLCRHQVKWIQKKFSPADLADAFIIIAATNDRAVNERIKQTASPHQLVNIVDDPEGSTFIVPASFKRGKLCMAVSTSGASPSLSKNIVRDLQQQFDDQYVSYLEFLDECRAVVKQSFSDPSARQKILRELASSTFEEKVRAVSESERKRLFTNTLRDWREKR
ncbi:siroheme synthase [Bacillus aerolatus]|uniref:precorrin-2 dehydrogenase n=1 Tax=Bacillus aerolatus TaxID=2653354 RepID=A0A6I1FW26_9BACI|nr:NAD(P)-dependent oxidoreductase [Bacillus aerolatus]KAB7709133.1 siroheme synthase [Bacillus aerolatus]